MKLILTDLDGTIRRPSSGKLFAENPYDQELIPGVFERLALHKEVGDCVIGITNQGGVATGHKTLNEAINEQKETLRLCGGMISAVYFCPNYDGIDCYGVNIESQDYVNGWTRFAQNPYGSSYRKPGAGMLFLAIALHGEFLSKEQMMMVGDRLEDEESAVAAGIRFQSNRDWVGDGRIEG